jgi:hypothetical protein
MRLAPGLEALRPGKGRRTKACAGPELAGRMNAPMTPRPSSLLLLALLLLAGPACRCDSTRFAPGGGRVPGAAQPSSAVAESVYAVVWGDDDKQGRLSVWLESRAERLKVLGKRSGAIVYTGEGIYAWQDTEAVFKGIKDCSRVVDPSLDPEAAQPKDNERDISVKGAVMRRLDAPGRKEVVEFENVENAESFENNVMLEGSAGPVLFVRESSSDNRCGAAHQNSSNELLAVRMSDDTRAKIPSEREVPAFRQRALALDRQRLEACVAANRKTWDPPAPDSLDGYGLKSLLPGWTAQNHLRFHVVFFTWRNSVDGELGCESDVDLVPEALAPYPPPAALSALLREMPGLQVRGWSALSPADAPRVPTVTRVFASEEGSAAGAR